ncbi:MAG TPA: hypothetical protein EYP68_04365 [Candidatus Korarchaeota archaeon]|nr:hypothetical protein [Candidatus Korarchaeota archaeon]
MGDMIGITFILSTSLLAVLSLYAALESKDSDKRFIECPKCHITLDREKLHVSGYDSENSSEHLHCPRCKAYIAI